MKGFLQTVTGPEAQADRGLPQPQVHLSKDFRWVLE